MLGVAALVVGGCSRDGESEVVEAARPVKTLVVEAPEVGGVRRFPARIDALTKAELAFRIPGTIQELPVKEGDQVEEGQMLIALDPTDYEIAVNDAQATFDQAENDFNRAKELVKDGFISRSDYDAKEAQWKNASAALDRAKQDLAYTRLTASFDGIVARRYVQRFEEVQAKQPVIALHDRNLLEVKVNVPESIILRIRTLGGDGPRVPRVPVSASFDNRPGKEFALTMREIATRADPATQTFEATFTMPAPEDFTVLPGMTATVMADLRKMSADEGIFQLPAAAVTADEAMAPFVWVVDEELMVVSRNPVEVGRMMGHSIEVTGGLEPGSRVVIAGVGYLAEGMKVRLMPEREEALPRPDEMMAPSSTPAGAAADTES